METLAFIHTAVAYEDPNPESELRSFEDLSLKAPGSIALGVLSAGVVTATLSHADQAQATIGFGDRGSGVIQLQRKLGGIAVDGVFGTQTYNRLISFQENNRLVPDGVAGRRTLPALGLDPYLGPDYVAVKPDPINPNVGTTAYVTARSGLRIRNSAGGIIGGLPFGTPVSLASYVPGGWSRLASGGYVSSQYLSFGGSSNETPVPTGPYVTARSGLIVRSGPAGSSIGGLGYGSPLSLTGAEQFAAGRNWSQLSSGGWVASAYIGYR